MLLPKELFSPLYGAPDLMSIPFEINNLTPTSAPMRPMRMTLVGVASWETGQDPRQRPAPDLCQIFRPTPKGKRLH